MVRRGVTNGGSSICENYVNSNIHFRFLYCEFPSLIIRCIGKYCLAALNFCGRAKSILFKIYEVRCLLLYSTVVTKKKSAFNI